MGALIEGFPDLLEASPGSDEPAVETDEWTGEKTRLKTGKARCQTLHLALKELLVSSLLFLLIRTIYLH